MRELGDAEAKASMRSPTRKGRRPKMFVAKIGPGRARSRREPRVSSAFGDLGFEIVAGPLFQTPAEAVEVAIKEDVDVVGASSASQRGTRR